MVELNRNTCGLAADAVGRVFLRTRKAASLLCIPPRSNTVDDSRAWLGDLLESRGFGRSCRPFRTMILTSVSSCRAGLVHNFNELGSDKWPRGITADIQQASLYFRTFLIPASNVSCWPLRLASSILSRANASANFRNIVAPSTLLPVMPLWNLCFFQRNCIHSKL